MSKLSTEIAKNKEKLTKKALKTGIYEDFGQKEVNLLKEKHNYIDLIYGSPEQRRDGELINDFDNWCMEFDLHVLHSLK